MQYWQKVALTSGEFAKELVNGVILLEEYEFPQVALRLVVGIGRG